jgi:hypothetical protein
MIKRQPGQLFSLMPRVISLTIFLCFSCAGPACSQQQQAIQLMQEHYFFGKSRVTAARDAVRIENIGRFKYVVVARAPDWRINIFRADDKTYFSESLQQFEETGLVSGFLVGRRNRYESAETSRKSSIKLFGRPAVRVTGRGRCLKYLPLDKETAQQVEVVIYSTYKLPTSGGLPVEVTGTGDHVDWVSGSNDRGRHEIYLSTSAISTVNVSSDIFDLPKNYTKARSIREVVAGSNTREESVDAQELFEMGRNKKSK